MLSSAVLALALFLASPEGVPSQFTCPEAATDAWLRETANPAAVLDPVALDDIGYVQNRESEALRMLEDRSVIALTPAEAEAFLGVSDVGRDERLRPYLVRLVAATANARLVAAGWSGRNLVMTTMGLGCRAETRRAVVIYADREPAQLIMRLRAEIR